MWIYPNLVAALRESDATPGTWTALINLAAHFNEKTHECFPTQKKQCQQTGLTDKTVRAAIEFAEERAWMHREVRSRSGHQVIFDYVWSPVLYQKPDKSERSQSGRYGTSDRSYSVGVRTHSSRGTERVRPGVRSHSV